MSLTQNKFLTEIEVDSLLANLEKRKGQRDSILLRLALFTGARGSELLELSQSDISEGSVTICGKKGSRNRTIPLSKDFYLELTEYAQGVPNKKRLFSITTRRLRAIWDQYRPNSAKGFHSLRHTCGVKTYASSRNVHLVQTLLGHKSQINTQVYLSYVESNQELRKVVEDVWVKKSVA